MKQTRRVLIVEDREDHQMIFKEIVESIGYKPEIAATVEESVTKLDRMSFHVALVDLSLDDTDPDNRDGVKVLAHIKAASEGTKAIVLTAYGGVPDADKTFTEYGLSGFIEKPHMDVVEVGQRIRNAAEAAHQEMMRPARQQDITSMIKGRVVSQFLEGFEAISEEGDPCIRRSIKLEAFLRRLLGKMCPLLPDKQEAIEYRLEGMGITVQARFWSKALGKPIVAWFGRFDEMKTAVRAMGESEMAMRKAGFGEKAMEVFDISTLPHLGGAVCTLKDVPFEEFVPPKHSTISV